MKRILFLLSPFFLSGCVHFDKLDSVGQTPALTPIHDPTQTEHYQRVQMPMPAPKKPGGSANSLWQPGARAFFKDQRASQVGDIVTVNFKIDGESADLSNETKYSREDKEDTQIGALLGAEKFVPRKAPDLRANADDMSSKLMNPLASVGSKPERTGTGSISRKETVKLKIPSVVTQILPNGNLVVNGRQEVRVNNEVREVLFTGVVRREDIRSDNSVDSDTIAEARLSYGGRGSITDYQRPRLGVEIVDSIAPF